MRYFKIPILSISSEIMKDSSKINIRKAALAAGILWGCGVFLLGIMGTVSGFGMSFINTLGSIYLGYSATYLGSVIGGVLGFIDGAVGIAIFAWIYNWI